MHDEVGSSTGTGALVGALLGTPLAVIVPVAGLAGPVLGGSGGALVGRLLKPDLDKASLMG